MNIIYQDEDLIVIDKPAGIICDEELVKKSGGLLVHRLDKDTSGLLIIAKSEKARDDLQTQFKKRLVKKTYLALVLGVPEKSSGEIKTIISRHPKKDYQIAQPMAFGIEKGKTRMAVTHYKVIKRFAISDKRLAIVEAMPHTGRMHQIRVHLKYLGHPVIGDPIYNTKESKKVSKSLGIGRQFLHATKLEFTQPTTGKKIVLESKLPEDLYQVIDSCKEF